MLALLRAVIVVLLAAGVSSAATVTHRVITADTGASPNTSGAFTPALEDLLIACVCATDTVDATGTLSSSIAGFTFSQIQTFSFSSSAHRGYCYVSDQRVSSATSQTVTWTEASDASSGTVIAVESVAGMTRRGLTAILQSNRQQNQAGGTTPAPAFTNAALTTNVTIGIVCNLTNPAGLTPPTSWTEQGDVGYATPTSGGEIVTRDSGFTGTTITWGSTSASAYGDIILELDTSFCPFMSLMGAGCR